MRTGTIQTSQAQRLNNHRLASIPPCLASSRKAANSCTQQTFPRSSTCTRASDKSDFVLLDHRENTDGSVTFSFGDSSEGKDSSVKQAKSPAKSPTQQSTSETLPQNGKSETSPVIENSLNEVQKQSIKSQNEEDPKKTEESENLISEQANEVVQKVEEAVKEIAKVEQPLVTEGINGHSAISQNAPKTEDSDLDPKEALQQLTVVALKARCKDAGLNGYSRMKKDELVELILSSLQTA